MENHAPEEVGGRWRKNGESKGEGGCEGVEGWIEEKEKKRESGERLEERRDADGIGV